MSSKTIYVKVAGILIPYTKDTVRKMFDSQIKTLKRNLVNKEDSKIIDKWLMPESTE